MVPWWCWWCCGDYGGAGGGRILLNMTDSVEVSGTLLANGGNAGTKGGGGSGGSVFIMADKMYVFAPLISCFLSFISCLA